MIKTTAGTRTVPVSVLRVLALVAAMATTAAAQDARTVIANASKAMGADGLNSITFYGAAQNGNFGQNNNANQPWPLTNLNDYSRSIDFTQPASRATWVTYVAAGDRRRDDAAQGTPQTQQLITPANTAWAQQLEIWITPWGFLKGAAANNAHRRARRRSTAGASTCVTFNAPAKSPGGAAVQGRRPSSDRRAWSTASRRGSRTRSSATCWSTPSTPTIATPTA